MSATAVPEHDPQQPAPQHLGVALSGGGHRACLFGLGALLYLVDAGKAAEITTISSVSGGSLANAYAGLGGDLRAETPAAFRDRMRPLAQACATKGSLFRGGIAYGFIAILFVLLAATIASAVWVGGWWAALIVAVGLLVIGWVAGRRGRIAEAVFDRTLFDHAPLSALDHGLDHVICATDLQTAEPVYFSGGFVQSYRLGRGATGTLTIARAVQCSSAIPGGFFPRRLPSKGLDLPHADALPHMLLTDGGVYDNMATEWFLGEDRRQHPGGIDELIVVNGSAAKQVRTRRLWPLVGEVGQLLAANNVLYDQTTAVRRRWLRDIFVHRPGEDFAGTLVQINRSPNTLPDQFAAYGGAKGARAKEALALLGAVTSEEWQADADANARVKTSLSAIGADRSARLLRHAYVLTMVNAHVLLDYPLLDLPDLATLGEWVS